MGNLFRAQRSYFRILAGLLVLAFLFYDISWASQGALPGAGQKAEVQWPLPRIPDGLGLIERVSGQGARLATTIYHIQDAHSLYEAQVNLAGILESLIREENISLVLVEGGSGVVGLDGLRKEAWKSVRERVAGEFLRKGKISGEEYLQVATNYPFELMGIEDPGLYRENIEIFLKALRRKDEALRTLRQLESILRSLEAEHFPAEFRSLEDSRKKWGTGGLLAYLGRLRAVSEEKGIDTSGFAEWQKLARLTRGEAAELPDLDQKAFFKELKSVESKVRNTYLLTPQAKTLWQAGHDLRLLTHLFSLELTSEEYAEIGKDEARFSARALAQKIGLLFRGTPLTEKISGGLDFLETEKPIFLKFYELARARDEAFARNIREILKEKKPRRIVLITGGFHSARLARLFENNRIAHVLISPKITEVPAAGSADYERILREKTKSTLRAPATYGTPYFVELRTTLEREQALELRTYIKRLIGLLDIDRFFAGQEEPQEGPPALRRSEARAALVSQALGAFADFSDIGTAAVWTVLLGSGLAGAAWLAFFLWKRHQQSAVSPPAETPADETRTIEGGEEEDDFEDTPAIRFETPMASEVASPDLESESIVVGMHDGDARSMGASPARRSPGDLAKALARETRRFFESPLSFIPDRADLPPPPYELPLPGAYDAIPENLDRRGKIIFMLRQVLEAMESMDQTVITRQKESSERAIQRALEEGRGQDLPQTYLRFLKEDFQSFLDGTLQEMKNLPETPQAILNQAVSEEVEERHPRLPRAVKVLLSEDTALLDDQEIGELITRITRKMVPRPPTAPDIERFVEDAFHRLNRAGDPDGEKKKPTKSSEEKRQTIQEIPQAGTLPRDGAGIQAGSGQKQRSEEVQPQEETPRPRRPSTEMLRARIQDLRRQRERFETDRGRLADEITRVEGEYRELIKALNEAVDSEDAIVQEALRPAAESYETRLERLRANQGELENRITRVREEEGRLHGALERAELDEEKDGGGRSEMRGMTGLAPILFASSAPIFKLIAFTLLIGLATGIVIYLVSLLASASRARSLIQESGEAGWPFGWKRIYRETVPLRPEEKANFAKAAISGESTDGPGPAIMLGIFAGWIIGGWALYQAYHGWEWETSKELFSLGKDVKGEKQSFTFGALLWILEIFIAPILGGIFGAIFTFLLQAFWNTFSTVIHALRFPFDYEKTVKFYSHPYGSVDAESMQASVRLLSRLDQPTLETILQTWVQKGEHEKIKLLSEKGIWKGDRSRFVQIYADVSGFEKAKEILTSPFKENEDEKQKVIDLVVGWRAQLDGKGANGARTLKDLVPELARTERKFSRLKLWTEALLQDSDTPWTKGFQEVKQYYEARRQFETALANMRQTFALTPQELGRIAGEVSEWKRRVSSNEPRAQAVLLAAALLEKAAKTSPSKEWLLVALQKISGIEPALFKHSGQDKLMARYDQLIGYEQAKAKLAGGLTQEEITSFLASVGRLEAALKAKNLDVPVALADPFSKLAEKPRAGRVAHLESFSNLPAELYREGAAGVGKALDAWVTKEEARGRLASQSGSAATAIREIESKASFRSLLEILNISLIYMTLTLHTNQETRESFLGLLADASPANFSVFIASHNILVKFYLEHRKARDFGNLSELVSEYRKRYGELQALTDTLLLILTDPAKNPGQRVEDARKAVSEQVLLKLGFPANVVTSWDAVSPEELMRQFGESVLKQRAQNETARAALSKMGRGGLYSYWEETKPSYYAQFQKDTQGIDPSFFRPGEKIRISYDRVEDRPKRRGALSPIEDPVTAVKGIVRRFRLAYPNLYDNFISPKRELLNGKPLDEVIDERSLGAVANQFRTKVKDWPIPDSEKIDMLVRVNEALFFRETRLFLGMGSESEELKYWEEWLRLFREKGSLKKDSKLYRETVSQVRRHVADLAESAQAGREGLVQFILTRGSLSDFFRGEVSEDCCSEARNLHFKDTVGLPADPAFLAFKIVENGKWIGNIYSIVLKNEEGKFVFYLDNLVLRMAHPLAAKASEFDPERRNLMKGFFERLKELLSESGFEYIAIAPDPSSREHVKSAIRQILSEEKAVSKSEKTTKPGGFGHQSEFSVSSEYIQGLGTLSSSISANGSWIALESKTALRKKKEREIQEIRRSLDAAQREKARLSKIEEEKAKKLKHLQGAREEAQAKATAAVAQVLQAASKKEALEAQKISLELQEMEGQISNLGEKLARFQEELSRSEIRTKEAGAATLFSSLGGVLFAFQHDPLGQLFTALFFAATAGILFWLIWILIRGDQEEPGWPEKRPWFEERRPGEKTSLPLPPPARETWREHPLVLEVVKLFKAVFQKMSVEMKPHIPPKIFVPIGLHTGFELSERVVTSLSTARLVLVTLRDRASMFPFLKEQDYYREFKKRTHELGLQDDFDIPDGMVPFEIETGSGKKIPFSLELSDRSPDDILRGDVSRDCTALGGCSAFYETTPRFLLDPGFLNFKLRMEGEWVGNVYALAAEHEGTPVLIVDAIQLSPWAVAWPVRSQWIAEQALSEVVTWAQKRNFEAVFMSRFISNFFHLYDYFDPRYPPRVTQIEKIGGFEHLKALGLWEEGNPRNEYLETFSPHWNQPLKGVEPNHPKQSLLLRPIWKRQGEARSEMRSEARSLGVIAGYRFSFLEEEENKAGPDSDERLIQDALTIHQRQGRPDELGMATAFQRDGLKDYLIRVRAHWEDGKKKRVYKFIAEIPGARKNYILQVTPQGASFQEPHFRAYTEDLNHLENALLSARDGSEKAVGLRNIFRRYGKPGEEPHEIPPYGAIFARLIPEFHREELEFKVFDLTIKGKEKPSLRVALKADDKTEGTDQLPNADRVFAYKWRGQSYLLGIYPPGAHVALPESRRIESKDVILALQETPQDVPVLETVTSRIQESIPEKPSVETPSQEPSAKEKSPQELEGLSQAPKPVSSVFESEHPIAEPQEHEPVAELPPQERAPEPIPSTPEPERTPELPRREELAPQNVRSEEALPKPAATEVLSSTAQAGFVGLGSQIVAQARRMASNALHKKLEEKVRRLQAKIEAFRAQVKHEAQETRSVIQSLDLEIPVKELLAKMAAEEDRLGTLAAAIRGEIQNELAAYKGAPELEAFFQSLEAAASEVEKDLQAAFTLISEIKEQKIREKTELSKSRIQGASDQVIQNLVTIRERIETISLDLSPKEIVDQTNALEEGLVRTIEAGLVPIQEEVQGYDLDVLRPIHNELAAFAEAVQKGILKRLESFEEETPAPAYPARPAETVASEPISANEPPSVEKEPTEEAQVKELTPEPINPPHASSAESDQEIVSRQIELESVIRDLARKSQELETRTHESQELGDQIGKRREEFAHLEQTRSGLLAEIQTLDARKKELEAQTAGLGEGRERKQNLDREMASLDDQIKVHQESLRTIVDQISRAREEQQDILLQRRALDAKVAETRHEFERINASKEKMERELKIVQIELEEKSQKVAGLSEKEERLREVNRKIQDEGEEVERKRREIGEANQLLEQGQAALKALAGETEKRRQVLEGLNQNARDLEGDLARQKQELEGLEASRVRLANEIRLLTDQKRVLEEGLKEYASLREQVGEATQALESARKLRKEADHEHSRLVASNTHETEKLKALRTQIAQAEETIRQQELLLQNLAAKEKERNTLLKEIERLGIETTAKQRSLETLSRRLPEMERRVLALQAEKETLTSHLEHIRLEIETTQTLHARVQLEYEGLQERLTQAKGALADLPAREQKLQDVNHELAEKENVIREKEEALREANRLIEEKTAVTQELNRQLAAKGEEIKTRTEALEALDAKLAQSTRAAQAHQGLLTQRETLETEIRQKQQELEGITTQKEEAGRELETIHGRLEKAGLELPEKEERLLEVKRALEEKEKELEGKHRDFQEADRVLEEGRAAFRALTDETETRRQILEGLNREASGIEIRLLDQKQELTDLGESRRSLTEEIRRLTDQKRVLEEGLRGYETLREEVKEATQALESARRSKEEAERERRTLVDSNILERERLEALRAQISQTEETIRQKESLLRELAAKEEERSALLKENERLGNEINAQQSILESLSRELPEMERRTAALEAEKKTLTQRLESIRGELETLETLQTKAQSEYAGIEAKLARAKEDFAHLAEREERLLNVTQELERNEQALREKEEALREAGRLIEGKTAAIQGLDRQLAAKGEENRRRTENIEALAARLAESTRTVQELDSRIAALKHEVKTHQTKKRELEEEREAMGPLKVQLDQTRQGLDQIIQQKEEAAQDYERMLAAGTKESERLAALQGEVAQMEERIRELEATLQGLEEKEIRHGTLTREIAQFETKLNQARAGLENLSGLTLRTRADHEEALQKKQALETQLSQYSREIEDLKSQKTRIQDELEALDENRTRLLGEAKTLDEKDREFKRLQAELEKERKDRADVESSARRLTEQIRMMAESQSRQSGQLSEMQNEKNALMDELDVEREAKRQAEAERDRWKSQREQSEQDKTHLEEEKRVLEEALRAGQERSTAQVSQVTETALEGKESLEALLSELPASLWTLLGEHFPGQRHARFQLTVDSIARELVEAWNRSPFFRRIVKNLILYRSLYRWLGKQPFYREFKNQAEKLGLTPDFDKPGEGVRFKVPGDERTYSLELSKRDTEYLLRGFFSGDCTNCGPGYVTGSFLTATGSHIVDPGFFNFKILREGEWVGNVYGMAIEEKGRPVLVIDAIQIPWQQASPLFIPFELSQSRFPIGTEKDATTLAEGVIGALGEYSKKVGYQELWLSSFVSNFSALKTYFYGRHQTEFDRRVTAKAKIGGWNALRALGYEGHPYVESIGHPEAKKVWPLKDEGPAVKTVEAPPPKEKPAPSAKREAAAVAPPEPPVQKERAVTIERRDIASLLERMKEGVDFASKGILMRGMEFIVQAQETPLRWAAFDDEALEWRVYEKNQDGLKNYSLFERGTGVRQQAGTLNLSQVETEIPGSGKIPLPAFLKLPPLAPGLLETYLEDGGALLLEDGRIKLVPFLKKGFIGERFRGAFFVHPGDERLQEKSNITLPISNHYEWLRQRFPKAKFLLGWHTNPGGEPLLHKDEETEIIKAGAEGFQLVSSPKGVSLTQYYRTGDKWKRNRLFTKGIRENWTAELEKVLIEFLGQKPGTSASGYQLGEDERELLEDAIERGEKSRPRNAKREIEKLLFDLSTAYGLEPASLEAFVENSDFQLVTLKPRRVQKDRAPPMGLGVDLGRSGRDVYATFELEPKEEGNGFLVTFYVGQGIYELAGEKEKLEILAHELYQAYRQAHDQNPQTYPFDIDLEVKIDEEIRLSDAWEGRIPREEREDLGLVGGTRNRTNPHVRSRAFARLLGSPSPSGIGTTYTDLLRRAYALEKRFGEEKPVAEDPLSMIPPLEEDSFRYTENSFEQIVSPEDLQTLFEMSAYIHEHKEENLVSFLQKKIEDGRRLLVLNTNAPTPWILKDIRKITEDLAAEGKLKNLFLDLPPTLQPLIDSYLSTGRSSEELAEGIRSRFPEFLPKEFQRPDLYENILRAVYEHNLEARQGRKISVVAYYEPRRLPPMPQGRNLPFPGQGEFPFEPGAMPFQPPFPPEMEGGRPPVMPRAGELPFPPGNLPALPLSPGVEKSLRRAVSEVQKDRNAVILFVKPLDEFLPDPFRNHPNIASILHLDRYTGFGPKRPENKLALYISEQASPNQKSFALPVLREAPFYEESINPGLPKGIPFNEFSAYPDLILSTSGDGDDSLEATPDEVAPEEIEPLVPVGTGPRSELRLVHPVPGMPAAKLDRKILDERRSAMKDLVRIGEPAVLPLIESLASPSLTVRLGAIQALGAIGDPRAIRPLESLSGAVALRGAAKEAVASIRERTRQTPVEAHRKKLRQRTETTGGERTYQIASPENLYASMASTRRDQTLEDAVTFVRDVLKESTLVVDLDAETLIRKDRGELSLSGWGFFETLRTLESRLPGELLDKIRIRIVNLNPRLSGQEIERAFEITPELREMVEIRHVPVNHHAFKNLGLYLEKNSLKIASERRRDLWEGKIDILVKEPGKDELVDGRKLFLAALLHRAVRGQLPEGLKLAALRLLHEIGSFPVKGPASFNADSRSAFGLEFLGELERVNRLLASMA